MTEPKDKLIRDSVHGYISVPSNICEDFIDTPIFQRLRNIEQTSMRVLYPSAHHDRFIHSLGVYHLGKKAFASLKDNVQRRPDDVFNRLGIRDEQWRKYEQTFELACLLHDCGHAPFSHTLEGQYTQGQRLDNELRAAADDESFREEAPECGAPHEKTSAILVLTEFGATIREAPYEVDPVLIARMILGCRHSTTTRSDAPLTPEEKFENCLIQLLNGPAIDVDKLDYILRDTWASGVDNVGVDVERLLGALTLAEIDGGFPKLAFAGRALSVLQSAVDARNYLYRWIYSHHKVQYDVALLKQCVERVTPLVKDGSFKDTLFSTDAFRTPVQAGSVPWFLPTDGDLICFLKRYVGDKRVPEVGEWLSRQHSRAALWKTFAEFDSIFKSKSERGRQRVFNGLKKTLPGFCREHGLPEDSFLSVKPNAKRVVIERDQLFVEVRGKPISYTEIFADQPEAEQPKDAPLYFLVYASKKHVNEALREECLEFLRSQS